MNKIVLWIIFCALSINSIHAQTIIDHLQSQTNASDGIIRVEADSTTIALIGKPNSGWDGSSNFTERQGYRIQVFMGNNPQKARAEGTSKRSAIQSAFPELPTYLLFESPNWRLLVGDFMTLEEANLVKQRLQKEFPQFGKEMFIVSEKIKFVLWTN